MKIKTIIISVLIIFFVIAVYYSNLDNRIYYLNITDIEFPYTDYILKYINNKNKFERYVNSYSDEDIRITDLIRDIEENKESKSNNKKLYLQNVLIKADIITLSIGNSDLYHKINYKNKTDMYDYIDELVNDYDYLFTILRKYCKETIILVGYQSPSIEYNEILNYYNDKLKIMCKKYNILFLDNDLNIKVNLRSILEKKL